jgi:hypothetical protein
MMKQHQTTITAIALTIMLFLAACGQNQVESETVNANGSSMTEDEKTAQQTDSVPPQEPAAPSEPAEEQDGSQYWVEVEDPTLGFRIAVPCFWRVETPVDANNSEEEAAEYSYSFFNYPADYPDLFEDGIIPADNNPFEIVFRVIKLSSEDISNGTSLENYINQEYNQELSEGTITELFIEEITLDEIEAVLVFVNEDPHSFKYYLMRISTEYLLEIKAAPSSKLFDTLDLQGVLNSITFDPEASVTVPGHIPGAFPTSPAAGSGASCIHGPIGNDQTP